MLKDHSANISNNLIGQLKNEATMNHNIRPILAKSSNWMPIRIWLLGTSACSKSESRSAGKL